MSNKNGVDCFMADLYIICGHGHGDSGAVGNGYTEAERVRALGKRIAELGGSHVHLLDTSRNWYADNGVSSLSIPKGACLVELHMDSGVSSARGAHVIIKAGIGGADKYDTALANKLAAIFPGRAKKIVERSDLANPNRAYRRGINYRLAENGFISNADDVNTFNTRMDEIARAYLEAFGITASTSAPSAPQTPSVPVNNTGLDLGSDLTIWGPKFTRAMQSQRGTMVDGTISGQASSNKKYFWAVESGTVTYEGNGVSALVRSLQQFIIDHGFSVGPSGVDGHMGRDTIRGHQQLLESWGFSVGSFGCDGYNGKDTNRAIASALQAGKYK